MKNKGGRPALHSDRRFYLSLVKQNEDLSYTDLAKLYNVSRSTIARWIARGKELSNNG